MLTSLYSGMLTIWNYETQVRLPPLVYLHDSALNNGATHSPLAIVCRQDNRGL